MIGTVLTHDREFRRRARTVVLIFIGASLLTLLLGYAAQLFLLVFGAALLGIMLDAGARALHTLLRVPRKLGVGVVALLILGIGALAGYFVAPTIGREVGELIRELPATIERAQERLARTPVLRELGGGGEEKTSAGDLLPAVTELVKALGTYTTTALYAVGSLAFVFLVGLYFAISPEVYFEGLVARLPPEQRAPARAAAAEIAHNVRRWLVGQLIAMVAVGVLIGGGLAIVGVPLALTLGVLSGLLAFVPYLGPLVAGGIVVLATAATAPEYVLGAGAVYLGAQLAESYVLTPLIQAQAVSLPPVLIIVGQLVLGALVGALGVVLSTPLILVALELTSRFWKGEDEEPRGPLLRAEEPTTLAGAGVP